MAYLHENQDHQLKKQDSKASSISTKSLPEDLQSTATGYPLPMDYPPGYPSEQSGYPIHIYNRSYSDHAYPYPQPPPQQFIPPQSQLVLPGFYRGIIAGTIFFAVFSVIIGLLAYFIVQLHLPVFHVVNFSVTNFNTPAAVWKANMTVKNPNSKLEMYFDEIDINIYHDTDLIATSTLSPFWVKEKKSKSLEMKLSGANPAVPAAVVMMAEERKRTRKVNVALEMIVAGNFRSGKSRSKTIWLKVTCENLKVSFLTVNSGNGNLSNGNTLKNCVVVES